MTPRIVLLVGLPGSGKSTWAAGQAGSVLSSDALRALLADDETAQGIHRQVFAALRYLLRQRLVLQRPVTYIDATHLEPWERRPYFVMGKRYNATVEAVWFDTPLGECKRRNALRNRKVPEDVLDAMAARLKPPSIAEGFTRVEVVR